MPRARGTCLVTGITAREQNLPPPPGACPLLSRVRPASCVPFMDFDAFSDACPILTDGFFDENMNYLQWNDTASSTQAPLFPDDSFTFDIEAGLPNDLPFSDGFPKNPWDLDSLFLHEADSTTWNPDWSGGNALDAINDLTSLMSSSDDFPGLEEFWMTADPSLAQAGSSSPTESPPVHLWGSDDNRLGFIKSISDWRCAAVDAATNRVCSGGKAVPKKLAQRRRNKNYILVCSHRDMIQCPAGHRTLEIPDFIDEELFLKTVSGEKIVEEEDQGDECCKVSSSRQGKKGKNICPFNHIKEGRPFEATVVHLPCSVELFVFIPHEDKHPELARKCTVIPDSAHPHRHPVPPLLKVTHAVAEKYKECVRKFGLGATVAKVEKAPSTKEILGGLTPSLYHLGLLSRDTKTKLINDVKSEPGNQAGYENQIRTLDCDTTFKPVVGKTNVYEINGWMPGINAEVTLGRVWIKEHDRRSFQFVWEELLALVKRLTNQKLGFAALHRTGTLLGFNADMEAAPLLGLADVLLPTIDIPSVAEEVVDALDIVKRIVRICYSHLKRGIPDISYLPREDQGRIRNFMYMETPEDVDEFKLWIRTLPDPNGVLLRWWEHKEMHQWLLPTVIECLSDMAPDDWHVIEATTNFGEAQHKANNVQTGIGMGLVESSEILDTRRAAEIETMLQSGNLHNPRNEVSHRYANRNARQVHATAKAKQTRVEEDGLRAAEDAVAAAQAHLKQIRAEKNSNSSGRVRPPRPRKKQPTKSNNRGATSDPPREGSTAPVHTNASGSVASVTGGDETIAASTLTPENAKGPARKRASSTSLESDAPPKRLKLALLRGWGVERDGANISATEYAQKHWSELQDEYPELLSSILGDDI
ncbi:hypothetical protein DFH09DRAFT_1483903 [Mycena vulgaris]|nr:hypothetical protein DFH09DRAFT_1483903 [Mycena vulgaris]